ncbi:DUF2946 domain-containing protein [Pseudomonas protegens]|uniref:DUF2946 domain-containing protein n=1 Tax=Pseudomonas protegens TaxID=380021 RepID=UPI002936DCCD|nr:DUF2946 domain-containing protein [Pseudomonas protegens]WOE77704.1 DUF2946 domain-containing protein [Pseudomonas protegens]
MTHSSSHRPHIAWMLYFCVLFNVFVCGLGHGQMAALESTGVGGQFCHAMGESASTLDDSSSDKTGPSTMGAFVCPLCSAVSLGLGLLFCLAWLLLVRYSERVKVERGSKAPPRYSWPSLNPRAPPLSA